MLAARGARPGDRIAMRLGNRVEFATTLLGILRLGAIAVPIGMRLQAPEVAYILELAARERVRVFDRLKDMINRGGYKVYSAEVENVLSAHPAVLESAIVSKPCPVLGERVHAFVTLKKRASEDDLRRFCAERLADYKIPETFTLLGAPLPRNANGKLLKRDLRERFLRGS